MEGLSMAPKARPSAGRARAPGGGIPRLSAERGGRGRTAGFLPAAAPRGEARWKETNQAGALRREALRMANPLSDQQHRDRPGAWGCISKLLVKRRRRINGARVWRSLPAALPYASPRRDYPDASPRSTRCGLKNRAPRQQLRDARNAHANFERSTSNLALNRRRTLPRARDGGLGQTLAS